MTANADSRDEASSLPTLIAILLVNLTQSQQPPILPISLGPSTKPHATAL
jgi:hypothetical protein